MLNNLPGDRLHGISEAILFDKVTISTDTDTVSAVIDISGYNSLTYKIALHSTVTLGDGIVKSVEFADTNAFDGTVFTYDASNVEFIPNENPMLDGDALAQSKFIATGTTYLSVNSPSNISPLKFLRVTITSANSANFILTGTLISSRL